MLAKEEIKVGGEYPSDLHTTSINQRETPKMASFSGLGMCPGMCRYQGRLVW